MEDRSRGYAAFSNAYMAGIRLGLAFLLLEGKSIDKFPLSGKLYKELEVNEDVLYGIEACGILQAINPTWAERFMEHGVSKYMRYYDVDLPDEEAVLYAVELLRLSKEMLEYITRKDISREVSEYLGAARGLIEAAEWALQERGDEGI